jgi:hypothetical protein
MCEKRMLRRISGPRTEPSTGEAEENEELYIHSRQHIIRKVKSKRIKWAEHVAQMWR